MPTITTKRATDAQEIAAPAEIKIPDAFQELKSYAFFVPDFAEIVGPESMQSTRSGVDGKYRLNSVLPGNYYVWASFGTSNMYIEWIVPVVVDGQKDMQIDLFNDNAATIKNVP